MSDAEEMAFLVIRTCADEAQQCFLFCFCFFLFWTYIWILLYLFSHLWMCYDIPCKTPRVSGVEGACVKFRLTLLKAQEIWTHTVLSLYPDSATWCYELNDWGNKVSELQFLLVENGINSTKLVELLWCLFHVLAFFSLHWLHFQQSSAV